MEFLSPKIIVANSDQQLGKLSSSHAVSQSLTFVMDKNIRFLLLYLLNGVATKSY